MGGAGNFSGRVRLGLGLFGSGRARASPKMARICPACTWKLHFPKIILKVLKFNKFLYSIKFISTN